MPWLTPQSAAVVKVWGDPSVPLARLSVTDDPVPVLMATQAGT